MIGRAVSRPAQRWPARATSEAVTISNDVTKYLSKNSPTKQGDRSHHRDGEMIPHRHSESSFSRLR